MNFYNEHDPQMAAWLRELIARDLIAPGVVDERSIEDIAPSELEPFVQCHFFAGIGGWSLALRLAGWPDDQPVWTGSCPCQPFSVAGSGRGTEDERHLWPVFAELIRERRPPAVFGEQVASAAGRSWLSSVRLDLEGMAYAVGAADLCAAGVGAPHIRQRLFWVGMADAGRERVRSEGHRPDDGAARGVQGADGQWERLRDDVGTGGACAVRVADADDSVRPQLPDRQRERRDAGPPDGGATGGMGDSVRPRREGAGDVPGGLQTEEPESGLEPLPDRSRGKAADGFWPDADWLGCRDGKWRPVEPGSCPLAARVPRGMARLRKGSLRGYGNAIVPQVAAEFIAAFTDCLTL